MTTFSLCLATAFIAGCVGYVIGWNDSERLERDLDRIFLPLEQAIARHVRRTGGNA